MHRNLIENIRKKVFHKKMMKQERGLREELEELHIIEQYEEALQITTEYIKALATALSQNCGRAIAEYTTSRIKTPESIIRKLLKKGRTVSVKEAIEYLNDIAGVRVICDYIDDIYAMQDAIHQWEDVSIVKEKDFIKKPKKSGYRSLHIILNVPLPSTQMEKSVRVEIQLRTVIMDFWARLDHRTRYKQVLEMDPELFQELNKCARLGKRMDEKLLFTRKLIEEKQEQMNPMKND